MPAYLLAEKIGVSNVTLSRWKDGEYGPRMFLFSSALKVLGYELKIVPIEGVEVTYTRARLGRKAYYKRKAKPCE